MKTLRSLFDLTPKQRRRAISFFDANVDLDLHSGCWIWNGNRTWHGYGRVFSGSKHGIGRVAIAAHRFFYELHFGPIPKGMVLDHRVCRNKPCVNPYHLVVCTHRENVLQPDGGAGLNKAKTHCLRGHALSGLNVGVQKDGSRFCLTCYYDASKRHNAEARQKKWDSGWRPQKNGWWQKQKTHCREGHPYSGDNLVIQIGSDGVERRICRACRRRGKKKYLARLAAKRFAATGELLQ